MNCALRFLICKSLTWDPTKGNANWTKTWNIEIFFFFHLTSKCSLHSTKWYQGKMSWEREPFCETRKWYFKISLHSKLSWKESPVQIFSSWSLYRPWHVQGRLKSRATADCCYPPNTKQMETYRVQLWAGSLCGVGWLVHFWEAVVEVLQRHEKPSINDRFLCKLQIFCR